MRIPTSTIVMSLVVCVPFGLAIRDTVKKKDVVEDQRWDSEAELQSELAAQQKADEDAKIRARAARAKLFGAPATLAGEPESTGDYSVDADHDGVRVHFYDCDGVAEQLAVAWGPGDTWLSADQKHQAWFESDMCTLTVRPYVDATAWVAAIPFDAIGRPAAELEAKLGTNVMGDDD